MKRRIILLISICSFLFAQRPNYSVPNRMRFVEKSESEIQQIGVPAEGTIYIFAKDSTLYKIDADSNVVPFIGSTDDESRGNRNLLEL